MSALRDITAGVLSYNRVDDLRITLDALLTIPELRIFVVDNASTDGSVALLENYAAEHATRMRLLRLESNIGIAARNLMFAQVSTPFLLTLDDDSWPRGVDDVLTLHAAMNGDARIASVCASCVHPTTRIAETAGIERFASAGPAQGLWDVVNIAAGGTLLRMDAIRETRGYGEEFFWGREENDLAFQLLLKGWRVTFLPSAVIWHSMSSTGRRHYERLRIVTRNSLWLLWKYFPLPVALPMSLLFALRRLAAVLNDTRRFPHVVSGLLQGYAGMAAHRLAGRFSLRQSWGLRGWLWKLLYE